LFGENRTAPVTYNAYSYSKPKQQLKDILIQMFCDFIPRLPQHIGHAVGYLFVYL
jgi:hypothetical protein